MVAVVIVIMCISYAIYSVIVWNSYQDSVSRSVSLAKAELTASIDRFTELKMEKIHDLNGSLRKIDEITDRMCQPSRFVGYQAFILGSLKQRVAECSEERSRVQAATDALRDLSDYLSQWLRLQQQVTTLTANEVKEADIARQADKWKTLYENTSKKTVGGAKEQQMNKDYLAVFQEIEKAWRLVAEKHAAKDYDGYNKAVEALNSGYAHLAEVGESAKKGYRELVDTAKQAYQRL